ncbi:N-succinylarginine dihydrolase [Pseudoalteromonas sp. SSDWG2]|uniref:N-succinylarginine dihydrolase n=1 Tax=Pseudoalteromonas sp. SSDWG2 TaxID=3139391 RepID=UPI003BAB0BD3
MNYQEVNFDGLVGPTHNYAGLSFGNVASAKSASQPSNPKQAALQGLAKMKMLSDMGLSQGVLAPHNRPALTHLKQLGFTGSDAQIVEKAYQYNPILLASCYSSSAMWTANAATVSPSSDTSDAKVHFTAANLSNKLHRSIEAVLTHKILQRTFANDQYFAHHQALPMHDHFGDEGAANHTRLAQTHGDVGLHMFVYGKEAFNAHAPAPTKFPARQTKEAFEAIARLHNLPTEQVIYIQQNPDVINQGVFHNDVIAVGNENMLLCHEQAYLDQGKALDTLQTQYSQLNDGAMLNIVEVPTSRVPIDDAVSSYLFNSQLITLPNQETLLLAPCECERNPRVRAYLESLLANNTLHNVYFAELKQSMQNGGGPACLRLRVPLSDEEIQHVNPKTVMNDNLYTQLCTWVNKHYRDSLTQNDLRDPSLITQSHQALDELTQIMNLGSLYDFQID